MRSAALVTLRQHSFEVGFAVVAALAAAVYGITIKLQFDAIGVPADCLTLMHQSPGGLGVSDQCRSQFVSAMAAVGETYFVGQGTVALSVMGILPFLVGLLSGLPIVARELEERTAQVAWWLNPSRSRWLLRQILPVATVVLVAMAVAAVAAIPAADAWVAVGRGGAYQLIGMHGILAVIRAFGAFGIGLAVGAAFGRILPAFIFGTALVLAILFAAGQARDAWVSRLPLSVLATKSAVTGEWVPEPGGQPTAVGWVSPSGSVISWDEARQKATDAGVPPPTPGDDQDVPASTWLAAHGYNEVPLGLSDKAALGWQPFDGGIFAAVGCLGIGTTFFVVNRRRPA